MQTELLHPQKLWPPPEILVRPCPIPKAPGVYAWYFRDFLSPTALASCHRIGEFALLYIGIASTAPRVPATEHDLTLNPQPGGRLPGPLNHRPSRQTLRHRIQYHLRGNAEGSSLRLTLGCLLASTLGLELRRVGSGNRMTFDPKEQLLSDWLEANARITWLEHSEPWLLETQLIKTLSLPLNLDQNSSHPFFCTLSALRAQARSHARLFPILRPSHPDHSIKTST